MFPSTLRRVLDTDDMVSFQQDWEAFVLALRFPDVVVSDEPLTITPGPPRQ